MTKNKISAEIVADSIGPFGDRITSYVLTYPRIIHAEFMTHRVFSRNAASSRAIPFKRMVKMVQEDPFIPIRWQKDHSGMQGFEYLTEEKDIKNAEILWLAARDEAVKHATALSTGKWIVNDTEVFDYNINITKQLCNRLLEPFLWYKCLVTATEWENFFALRAHPDAEIHIQALAYKMLEAANASTPKELAPYEWHIPFGENFDEKRIETTILEEYAEDWVLSREKFITKYKLMIATARCARVSYLNFEGKDDYSADVRLYSQLLKAGHMSPFEHCAFATPDNAYNGGLSDTRFMGGDEYGHAMYEYGWEGNFRGFRQLRKTLPNENKTDERYNRK